ncbi:MAG: ferredoxin [Frankiaceae bacterium]|jgi:ferredoxin|nr:ferredoxin [Frankiaceae bacterium]
MSAQSGAEPIDELQVWIDQDLCTGDGLCVQLAPEVFEFDIDGLAYVKGADGELRTAKGAAVTVPPVARLDVITSAKDCPGACIYVRDSAGNRVAGPLTD